MKFKNILTKRQKKDVRNLKITIYMQKIYKYKLFIIEERRMAHPPALLYLFIENLQNIRTSMNKIIGIINPQIK